MNISAKLPDKPDQGLLSAIGSRSFPTCVIMDPDGKVIVKSDTLGAFRPTTEDRLKSSLKVVQELLSAREALKEQPDSSSAKATLQMIEAILQLRPIPRAELEGLDAIEGVPESVRKRFDRWRAVQPVSDLLKEYVAKIRTLPREDKEARTAAFKDASAKMLALHLDGIVLDDPRQGIFSDYWRLVFDGAFDARNAEVAARALSIYRRAFGSRPELRNRIDRMATLLGALRQTLEKRGSAGDDREEPR